MEAGILFIVRESWRSTPRLPEYDTSRTLRTVNERCRPNEKLFTCGSRNLVFTTLNGRPAKVRDPPPAPCGGRIPSGNGLLILLFKGSRLSSAEETSGALLLNPAVCSYSLFPFTQQRRHPPRRPLSPSTPP